MQGPETRLRKKIVAALQESFPGALFLKIHGSPMQNVGIPDLLCCVHGLYVGIEIKCPGKEPTPAQKLMLDRIIRAGGIAFWTTSAPEAVRYLRQQLTLPKFSRNA